MIASLRSPEQVRHGLLFVAPGNHGAEHDGVAVLLGGGVERLDDAHVVRVAHGEQHPQLPAAGAPQELRGGVRTVAQLPGHLEHALARLRHWRRAGCGRSATPAHWETPTRAATSSWSGV